MISNYLLNAPGHGDNGRIVFRDPKELKQVLGALRIVAPTISAHCAAYAHLSAKWSLEYAEKFVPSAVLAKGAQYVEDWSEEYLVGLLEAGTAAGIHTYGWFWGLWGNPVLHCGYPWVFGWDKMMSEGLDRFREKTARIRARGQSSRGLPRARDSPCYWRDLRPRLRPVAIGYRLRPVPVRLG